MRLSILNLSTHCPSTFVILMRLFHSSIFWFLFNPKRFDFTYSQGCRICSLRRLRWVCLQRTKSFLASCKQKELGTQLIEKSEDTNPRMSLQKQQPKPDGRIGPPRELLLLSLQEASLETCFRNMLPGLQAGSCFC